MATRSSLLFGAASSSSGLESNHGLEAIVDPPLETSEGTDHDDSGHETSPETLESYFGVDGSDFAAQGARDVSLGNQLGEDGVCGVGNYGAEDTSEVTRGEGDSQLGGFAIVLFSLGEDVVIEELDEPFEGDELHNCVGNLSTPQRTDSGVESFVTYIIYCLPSVALK